MMHEAVPIVFIVIGLPVICVTLIVLLRMRRADEQKRAHRGVRDEELEVLEEVYEGLKQLRRRVENLETILGRRDDEERRRR